MSNKILVLLIGVLVVLMLGMGGGLFMMWNQISAMSTHSVANASNDPNQEETIEQPLGPILSLDIVLEN